MREVASPNLNNVTGSKQTVNATTGIALLASNDVAKRYWFSDESLTSEAPKPVASFSATPTSGVAPLTVQFTDASSGSPTAWSWDFGDGSAADTSQNPTHVYSSAGTFSVSLTAVNSSGSSTITKTSLITISAVQSPAQVTAGASTSNYSSTATTAVTLETPSGLVEGDTLVAHLAVNNKPSMTSVPSGWSAVPGVSATSIGTGARMFAYYHVVGDPANEPVSSVWQLSSEQKWGGGVTVFQGADPSNPFGVTAVTKVDATYAASSLTLPGITTPADGSMLVSGLACDCATLKPTVPTAWTQPWGSTGGKYAGLAYSQQGQLGASGSVTWTLGAARGVAGWLTALKPAG